MGNKKVYLLLIILLVLPFTFKAFLISPIVKLQIIIPDSNEDLTCNIYYEKPDKTIGKEDILLSNGKTAITGLSWYNTNVNHTGLVVQCPLYFGNSITVSLIKQEETNKFTIQTIYNPEVIDIDNDGYLDLKENETEEIELDNCLFLYNPDQNDCDNDKIGDACDSDSFCSTDSDLDSILDDLDKCRLTHQSERNQTYIEDQDSEWYGCGPSERDLDKDNVCDGEQDLTSYYNNPNSYFRCSPGPDFCPGITGTYCKGCPNFCASPTGKIACTTINYNTANRLTPPVCNQLPGSPCGTTECNQNNNYCSERDDGFYYCTPPDQKQMCILDENNQHGYCIDTECLVPEDQFNLFCKKNQECVDDDDSDGTPDILDCNPNDNTISQCTGCSICSEKKCVPSNELCEPITCKNGCGTGNLSEYDITYVGTSLTNPEVNIPNLCSINSNNMGTCSQNECQIQTKVYSRECDPDWDDDKICNGNVSVTGICSISPTGQDECPELNSTNSLIGCPDVDDDGVHDGIDVCPYTYLPSFVNYQEHPSCILLDSGCIMNDTDKDGVCDELEKKGCIKQYQGCNYINDGVDNLGCISDSDLDNVCDPLDKCSNTLSSCTADQQGCPFCNNTNCFDPICNNIISCEADNETICNAFPTCYWNNSTCTFCGTSTLCISYLTEETCKQDSCSVRNCVWFNEQCIQKSIDEDECDYDYDCGTDEICDNRECISLSCIEDEICKQDEPCDCIDCLEEDRCSNEDYDEDGYTNSEELEVGTDLTNKLDYPKSEKTEGETESKPETEPIKKSSGLWWKITLFLVLLIIALFFLKKKGLLKINFRKKKPQQPLQRFQVPPRFPPPPRGLPPPRMLSFPQQQYAPRFPQRQQTQMTPAKSGLLNKIKQSFANLRKVSKKK